MGRFKEGVDERRAARVRGGAPPAPRCESREPTVAIPAPGAGGRLRLGRSRDALVLRPSTGRVESVSGGAPANTCNHLTRSNLAGLSSGNPI